MTETPMDPPQTDTSPPVVMCRGSRGPAVKPVLQFLADFYRRQAGEPHPELVVDEDFGEVGESVMRFYQLCRSGNMVGSLNLWTVRRMREDGFNWEAAANSAGPGTTAFINYSGNALYWEPGSKVRRSESFGTIK